MGQTATTFSHNNISYFINPYWMCLILPYIQSCCEKLRKVSTCIHCIISIVTKILPKSYIHSPRPRHKVSNQSMSSENILLKRRVEVFDRVYLLFNLVTSNQSFFNSMMRNSSLLKMLAMSFSS